MSHFSVLMSASFHSGQMGNFPFFCSLKPDCTLPKGYWLEMRADGVEGHKGVWGGGSGKEGEREN